MICRRAATIAKLVTVLVSVAAPAARAKTFAEILGTPLTQKIGEALGQSVARSLPVTSASAGIVYTFDPTTGAFERETSMLGQLFLERADPVGRKRLNFSLSYQRVEIDTFEGQDIHHLSDKRFPIVDPVTGDAVRIPLFGIDLETHQITAGVTYGLSDDVDVNLTVPVVYSEFRLRIVQQPAPAGPFETASSKLGVGDIFLRGKYRFLARSWVEAAGGLVLRVPAGSDENFQGTGAVELAPMLYASTRSLEVGHRVHLQGYFNGGIDLDADDVGSSEGRYGLGLDCGVLERFTAAVAFLARHPFRRIARPGFFDFQRFDRARNPGMTLPIFGLRGERPDLYDLSVGGRVNLWRDVVIGFANVIVPLNDDGVRADVIPLVGIEATF